MKQNTKYRSVSVSAQTMDLLMTVKSCYQLATRETVTYDELISRLVTAGLKESYPRVYEMLSMVSEQQKATLEEENLLAQETASEEENDSDAFNGDGEEDDMPS